MRCWHRCREAEPCWRSTGPRSARACSWGRRNIPRLLSWPEPSRRRGQRWSPSRCGANPVRERAGQGFWSIIRELGVRVLPNTAGCHSAQEAVTTAQMARELFGTPWIKLEVIGNHDTLQPDPFGLVEAARILVRGGLRGVPLHHRGPDRGRAPARRRLPGADALGCADRLRPRPCQPLRPAHPARPLSRGADGHRRGHRRCRRTPPRRWSSATTRSCSTPPSPRPAIPSAWPTRSAHAVEAGRLGFRGRPHGRPRHGGALDAGAGHRVLGLNL